MSQSLPLESANVSLLVAAPTVAEAATITTALRQHLPPNTNPTFVTTAAELEALLTERHWDVVVSDPALATDAPPTLLKHAPTILLARTPTVNAAVDLMRLGARGVVDHHDHARLIELVKAELNTRHSISARDDAQGVGQQAHQLETLQRERETYRTQLMEILDTTQDALISVALPNQAIIYASRSCEKVFGYPAQAFLDDPELFRRIVHPDDLPTALDAMQTCLREGYSELDHRIVMPDGQIRWVHHRTWVHYDENGLPNRIDDYIGDITARKITENELRFHSQILQHMTEGVQITRASDGMFMYVNSTFEQMFGYEPGELIGQHVSILNNPAAADPRVVADNIMHALQASGKWSGEIHNIRKDGTPFWSRGSVTTFDHAEYGPVWISVQQDVTEQKQVEEALRISEDHFKRLLRTAPVAILLADQTGTITLVNEQAEQLFGYDAAELLGQSVDVLVPDAQRHLHAQHRDTYLAAPKRRRMHTGEVLQAQRKDGSLFPVEIELGYLRNRDNLTAMSFISDITPRIQAQAALQYQATLLQQVTDAVIATDDQQRITAWNEAATNIYGWTEAEALGQPVDQLLQTDWQSSSREEVREMVRRVGYWRGEARQQTKDGQVCYILTSISTLHYQGQPIGDITINHDITKRKRQDLFQIHLSHVLEAVAEGQPLANVLELLVMTAEEHQPHLRASVLLLDNATQQLRHGAAPSLPDGYTRAIDGVVIGPKVGSCGTAAYEKRLVIVEDIQTDPLWDDYRDIASQYDLRACWSQPILHHDQTVLGTFALYYDHPRTPTQAEIELIQLAAHVAGIAIRRTQAETDLRKSEDLFQRFMQHLPATVFIHDHQHRLTYCNPQYAESLGLRVENLLGKRRDEYDTLQLAEVAAIEDQQVLATNRAIEFDYFVKATATYWHLIKFPVPQADTPPFVAAIGLETTQQMQAEAAHHASEERYRSLIESSDAAISMVDAAGSYLYLNTISAQPFGVPAEALLGKSVHDLFTPDHAHAILRDVQQVIQQNHGMVLETEVTLGERPAWFRTSIQPVRDAANQPYAAMIYASEITDKKCAEIDLRASERRYRSIVEDQTELVCRYDRDFRITFANGSFCRTYGVAAPDIIGQSVFRDIPPLELEYVRNQILTLTADNPVALTIHSTIQPNGSLRWFEWKDRAIFDEHGQLTEYQGVGRDITEQRRMVEALRASEMQLRSLINSQTSYVIRTDLEGKFSYWNSKFEHDYGWVYQPTGIKDGYSLNSVCEYHHHRAFETVEKCMAQPGTVFKVDIDKPRPDGSINTTLWEFVCLTDANGTPTEIQCMGIDISDRIKAENALRESEEHFRFLFKNNPHPMWVYDRESLAFLEVNDSAVDHYGYTHDEFLSMTLLDIRPAEDMARLLDDTQHDRPALQHSGQWRHILKNGQLIPVEITSHTLDFAGRPAALVVAQDITERKQAEDALQANHRLLEQRVIERTEELERAKNRIEAIFNHSGDAILLLNIEHGIQQANYAFDRMYDVPPDSYVGRTLSGYFVADDAATIDNTVTHVATTHQTRHVEVQALRQDGTMFDVEISLAPINRSTDDVTNIVAIIRDVTERKQAQLALQKYAAEVHDLYDNAPTGYHSLDKHGTIVQINETTLRWLGYERAEVVDKLNIRDILTPASQQVFAEKFPLFLEQGWIKDIEYDVIRKDGSIFAVMISATAVYDANGQFVRSRSTLFDITDLRRAERAVAEERNLLRTLIDAVPDYIYVKDIHHRLLLSNRSHAISLGMGDPTAVMGKTDLELFPPDMALKFHADEDQIFATGQAILNTEERSIGTGGAEIWALTTKVPLRNLNGEIIGLAGTTHDISHLKASEEALRRSQADLQSVIDSTATGFTLLDRDGKVRVINRLAQAISHVFDVGHLEVGMSIDTLIPPQYQAGFFERFHRVLNGEMIAYELMRQYGQTPSYFEFRYYPVCTLDGEIIGVNLAMDDITERKQVEQQLRYLASLQEYMYDAVIGTDMDYRVQSWNRAAERMYGYTADEAIGKNIADLIKTEYGPGQSRASARANLIKQGTWVGEAITHRKDGVPVHVLASIVLMRDDSGKPLGVIGVNHDITARKQAEQIVEQKRLEEQKMQGYLKALHEASLVLTRAESLDDFYRRVVEAGLERFGFERMGLLLYDSLGGAAVGTYGTDANGHLIDERTLRLDPTRLTSILNRTLNGDERVVFEPNVELFANGERIGIGDNVVATMWNDDALGWLAVDNGIRHEPITQAQVDILSLYALTAGSLLARKRAEVALRESESRYRLLAENIHDVILKISPEGIRTYVTPSAYVLVGYRPEELMGDSRFGLVHPDDLDYATTTTDQALAATSTFFTLAIRLRHKDGHYLWVEASNTIVRDRDTGRPLEIIALVRDITERKRTEDALRESESRYRLLAENIQDVIVRFSPDGIRSYVTPSIYHLLGYYPEELVGQGELHLIHPDDEPHAANRLREAAATGAMFFTTTYRVQHKAGHYVWVEVTTTLVRDTATGDVVEFISILHDITERKSAEAALRANEEKFRQFIESAPIATLISDHNGVIVLVNQAAEQLFDYPREELIGQSIDILVPDELKSHHPKHRAAYMSNPASRSLRPLELTARRKDGTLFPADVQLSGVELPSATLIMSFVIDVTERQAAEVALRQSLAQEKELGELKSRFVSMASHEFRTPLAAILATTETLTYYRDKMNATQIDDRLEKIRHQVNHMKDIMDEVLQLARIQAGRVEFKPTLGDLDALSRAIVEEFDSQPLHRGRIHYTCTPPSIVVNFDQRLMRHIISNLVSNALKYSAPDQPVHLHWAQANDDVVLTVADTGIGIPPDDQKRLFEPFHRANNVGTISGTGLGLSITKQAVELHRGTIVLESSEGQGTTFRVTLPALKD